MTKPTLLPSLAPLLLLAACAEESGDDGGGEAETEASEGASSKDASSRFFVGETGWLTVGSDGAVQTTFFDPDGRYRDLRNGALFASGSWEQRADGTICFEPDAGLGACWETSAPDENGSATATNSDGKSIEIKQVTYIAPPAEESDEGAES